MSMKAEKKEYYEKLPLYCQLAETIEKKIDSGEWNVGTCIPSERELSSICNMSRITVRKAIDELERKGKLEKVQGKGTYVLNHQIVQNLNAVYSFSKEMEKQGKITSTKLIERSIIPADARVARNLKIEAGSPVIYLKRLRCDESGQAIMVEKTYFDKDKYPYVLEMDFDKDGLYKTLEEKYGLKIDKATERFKACELTLSECQLLDCPIRQYGLLVRRTSYSGNQLVCYSSIVSKGDIFEFTVSLG